MAFALPHQIADVDELENILSEPSAKLVEFMATLDGPLVVLGAAGKMGPTLCLLAKRAAALAEGTERRATEVVAVSRFSSPGSEDWFHKHGIKTVRADLLMPDQYDQLPDASNVLFLVGQKFGTSNNPEMTWAINTIVPTRVAERYRAARIVALSTGNVYPLVDVASGGCNESDPTGPIGEYANACLARERLFEFAASRLQARSVLIRLNYALELRYGVLVDIAQKIKSRQPIDVTMGYLNFMWQRDANERVIRSLDLASAPPSYLNLTGTTTHVVRDLATRLASLMGLPVDIVGDEAPTALLSNSSKCVDLFGNPETGDDDILRLTASWVAQGGASLGKATHFQQRDGKF